MSQILYVDDNAADLDLAATAFADSDIPFVCTHSVPNAMDMLKEDDGKWLLVISDLIMPGDDGFQFARNLENQNINIPIMFASGISLSSFGSYTGLKNYKGFVLKPITPEKLAPFLEEA